MPTPSSQPPPEPSSPRSYPFSFSSTCPDEINAESADSTSRPPVSPSSWHPHPPHPYLSELPGDVPAPHLALPGDDPISRSDTMSPRPQSISDEPPEETTSQPTSNDQSADTHHKQGEMDTDMGDPDSMEIIGEPVTGIEQGPSSLGLTRPSGVVFSGSRPRQHHQHDYVADEEGVSLTLDGSEWDGQPARGFEYSIMRVIPTTPSSFLRPGSRFHGSQQSERSVYDVQVEIKHVDLRESFLCGFLKIQGLTEDHPTLVTYFEGEIIGPKYGFITKHPSWGANEKIDLSHWAKFTAFRPYAKLVRKRTSGLGDSVAGLAPRDLAQRENIFMRWKEHFLVPDHRVRTITGASFEGFYYICFNQVRGEVSGIYFHSKSEKFQQLELKHVENKGCFGSMEFR